MHNADESDETRQGGLVLIHLSVNRVTKLTFVFVFYTYRGGMAMAG